MKQILMGLALISSLGCFGQSKYPVKLIVLERVSSGAKVGSKVPMLVAEDVKDSSGKVIVKADTPAYAEIVQSRKAGTLSNALATPARLEIRLDKTYSVEKKPLSLETGSGESTIPLTRKNTSEMDRDPKIEAAWKDPQQRQLLRSLVSSYDSSYPCSLSAQQISILQQNAANLSLTSTAQLCQAGHISALNQYMSCLRSGTAFVSPAGVEMELVGACAIEMANLCRRSSGYIGGRFEGRNIVAPPGMEITAEVVAP